MGSTQTVSNDGIFKYGAAQGIGKAMDRLADYNINRAEQYHPVIQLSAGTVVDIVFLKGFSLLEPVEPNQSEPLPSDENHAAQNSPMRIQDNV